MAPRRVRWRTCALVVTVLALASRAEAQPAQSPKEAARALMDEADQLVEQRKLAEALVRYERAHALMHVPTTGIEVARTRAAMGRLVEAIEAALEVDRLPRKDAEPPAFGAARREAEELAARLTIRVPTVQVDLAPDLDPNRVRVDIDEEPIPPALVLAPRAVNPGRRVVRVSSPGRVTKTFTVDAKEGGRTRLRVVLEEGSGEGGLPPLAVAGFAIAGVGLLVGSITGIVSLGQASDARTLCGPDTSHCDPAARGAVRSAETTGWVSTISFVVGLAGGGLAAHALLSRPSPSTTAGGFGGTF